MEDIADKTDEVKNDLIIVDTTLYKAYNILTKNFREIEPLSLLNYVNNGLSSETVTNGITTYLQRNNCFFDEIDATVKNGVLRVVLTYNSEKLEFEGVI